MRYAQQVASSFWTKGKKSKQRKMVRNEETQQFPHDDANATAGAGGARASAGEDDGRERASARVRASGGGNGNRGGESNAALAFVMALPPETRAQVLAALNATRETRPVRRRGVSVFDPAQADALRAGDRVPLEGVVG